MRLFRRFAEQFNGVVRKFHKAMELSDRVKNISDRVIRKYFQVKKLFHQVIRKYFQVKKLFHRVIRKYFQVKKLFHRVKKLFYRVEKLFRRLIGNVDNSLYAIMRVNAENRVR